MHGGLKFMEALEGIKVIDLTRFVAGPFCSMQLADLGAEVVKFESPPERGDELRGWGPPFIDGQSYYFLTLNKNKKSISLDMRTPQGLEIVRKMIKRSDILVENFRPGIMKKMGLSWQKVNELNPRIIYCSVTAYGHTGPFRTKSGFDVQVQGDSGFMDITGFDVPTRVGVGLTDMIGAFYGVIGILASLHVREKTGRGQHIDSAMMDGMVALLTYQAGTYFSTGKTPIRLGNRHPLQTPYEAFAAKDGHVIIGAGSQKLWENLCNNVLMRPDLINDPRFLTMQDRNNNEPVLKEIIEEITRTKPIDEWIALLEKGDVPCGKVRSVEEALELEQTKVREMVVEMEDQIRGKIKLLGIPTKLSATPGRVKLMPPVLGEHTEEVLKQLGYGEMEIKALEDEGIVRQYRKKGGESVH
jgi:crotonobetainyl-CoA:carnitine CoA-transferase CaiB-like acyl-CoA transferase